MYIKKLIIKNYKSIKDETFVFNKGINVLVGKNNAGKSNIVLALNEILDDKYNATSYEDRIFYCNENNGYEKIDIRNHNRLVLLRMRRFPERVFAVADSGKRGLSFR